MEPNNTQQPIQQPQPVQPVPPVQQSQTGVQQEVLPETPPPPPNAQANKKSLILILGVIVLVVIFAGLSGILLLRENTTEEVSVQVQKTVPTIGPSATPTPSSLEEKEAMEVIIEDPSTEVSNLEKETTTL